MPSILLVGTHHIFSFYSITFFRSQHNSFEQFCINFCNEVLQFHFNEHIFKGEKTAYMTDGINLSDFQFQDNQATIDLIAKVCTCDHTFLNFVEMCYLFALFSETVGYFAIDGRGGAISRRHGCFIPGKGFNKSWKKSQVCHYHIFYWGCMYL